MPSHHICFLSRHVMVNAHARVYPVPTHEISMPRLPMRTSCPELGVHEDQIRSEHIISHRCRVASHRIHVLYSQLHVKLGYSIRSSHCSSSIFLRSASLTLVPSCLVTPRVILLPRFLFLTDRASKEYTRHRAGGRRLRRGGIVWRGRGREREIWKMNKMRRCMEEGLEVGAEVEATRLGMRKRGI